MRHLITPLLAAAAIVLSANAAYADLGDQLFKLLPDDGAAEDVFGRSVAISGATAIVGARWDDDNGTRSGSAYLFDITTGRQLFKLLPNDGAAFDFFGGAVAISGTTAIVGAPYDNDNGTNSGSAYLFDISDPANPTQLLKLLPDDGAAGDRFGNSVAISGTPGKEVASVGAVQDDDNGINSGAAYLFDTTTGRQIAKLLPDDGAAGDRFGNNVRSSGATAIVGARRNDDNGLDSGSAYLFDTTTGRQIAKLLPDDGAAFDLFGHSVAISGSIAIVGAVADSDNGTNSGSVYLFNTATGRQIAKLLPNDGAGGDSFGVSVAISGAPGKELAIVGANRNDDNGINSGSAYLFDLSDPKNPVQIAKLLPNDGAAGDQFGSVAISSDGIGTTAIVGASFDDDNGDASGSAYLFDAAAPGTCPWDLDDNTVVGASDLLALLASWGPCKECPADFDGNGTVGASDLLALLANWGPCP